MSSANSMKVAIQQLYANSSYTKIVHWGKLISMTGGTQIAVQGSSLLAGILIIRLLPVQEYAYYTIANTMLGTMTVLSDGGISNGIIAQGGKVWQDKEKLGAVLATGLKLRQKFTLINLILLIPVLLYLLSHQGADWLTCFFIVIALIPAFLAATSDSLLEVVPKLHQEIKPLQINELIVNIGRLLLSSLMLLIFPLTFIALLASGLPRIYGNIRLRKISYLHIKANQQPDTQVQTKVIAIMKRTLPGAIYYCVVGQITIWLISILGNTDSVAQIGALSRISIILNLFTALFGTLITPRFARLPNNSKLLFNYYLKTLSFSLLILCTIIGIVWLLSTQVLLIIGHNYSGLQTELMLTIIGSSLNLVAGTAFSLCSSRGWVLSPIISLPINLLSIIGGISIFNFSNLQGVLSFNLFVASCSVLVNVTYCIYSTKSRLNY